MLDRAGYSEHPLSPADWVANLMCGCKSLVFSRLNGPVRLLSAFQSSDQLLPSNRPFGLRILSRRTAKPKPLLSLLLQMLTQIRRYVR